MPLSAQRCRQGRSQVQSGAITSGYYTATTLHYTTNQLIMWYIHGRTMFAITENGLNHLGRS